jgi:hypothetical protein
MDKTEFINVVSSVANQFAEDVLSQYLSDMALVQQLLAGDIAVVHIPVYDKPSSEKAGHMQMKTLTITLEDKS